MKKFDVIVLGGGAAGLMCAMTAGQRGRSVLVLEGANKIGKKILMSGGGRCNFTNLYCEPAHYLSHNPHFCKSALKQYTQWDFIALVEKHEIAYHEKTLGQLFCDNSSKDILRMLEQECFAADVQIKIDSDVSAVTYEQHYAVESGHGRFEADSLVIATGGLSIPRMGATDFGFRLARQFDLPLLETRAGLVPFTFSGELQQMFERLAGVSLDAYVSVNESSFREGLLFTHRGLSGPSILQISSYWLPGDELNINLLPDDEMDTVLLDYKRQQPRKKLHTLLAQHLPKGLLAELEKLYWSECVEVSIAEISDKKLSEIAAILNNWSLKPTATEGYRTAEVTLQGIDTKSISSKTMECNDQPGLFCVGEVLDVTGHLGGYNFQWAWSSGYVAGLHA